MLSDVAAFRLTVAGVGRLELTVSPAAKASTGSLGLPATDPADT